MAFNPIPVPDVAQWTLSIAGLTQAPMTLKAGDLDRLPNIGQSSRLKCVQCWSGRVKWEGFRAQELLKLAPPKAEGTWVRVECADKPFDFVSLEDLLRTRPADRRRRLRVAEWVDEALAGGAGRSRAAGTTAGSGSRPCSPASTSRCRSPARRPSPRSSSSPGSRTSTRRSPPSTASDFGLQAGIFTRDWPTIARAFDELEVGGLVVNDVPTFRIDHMPYGGVKQSGLGREGIRYAIEEMTEMKLLALERPVTTTTLEEASDRSVRRSALSSRSPRAGRRSRRARSRRAGSPAPARPWSSTGSTACSSGARPGRTPTRFATSRATSTSFRARARCCSSPSTATRSSSSTSRGTSTRRADVLGRGRSVVPEPRPALARGRAAHRDPGRRLGRRPRAASIGVFDAEMPAVYTGILEASLTERRFGDATPVWQDLVASPSPYDSRDHPPHRVGRRHGSRRPSRPRRRACPSTSCASARWSAWPRWRGVPARERDVDAHQRRLVQRRRSRTSGRSSSPHAARGGADVLARPVRVVTRATTRTPTGRSRSASRPPSSGRSTTSPPRCTTSCSRRRAPGCRGGDLWEKANKVAVDAGYGDHSNHVYLGHTTGITTSSRPVVARGETAELRPGSFLNVEPGIFVPGVGSACIENTLHVTDDGGEPDQRVRDRDPCRLRAERVGAEASPHRGRVASEIGNRGQGRCLR